MREETVQELDHLTIKVSLLSKDIIMPIEIVNILEERRVD